MTRRHGRISGAILWLAAAALAASCAHGGAAPREEPAEAPSRGPAPGLSIELTFDCWMTRDLHGQDMAILGREASCTARIRNTGTAAAQDLAVDAVLPEAAERLAGSECRAPGSLGPGEAFDFVVRFRPRAAGTSTFTFRVRAGNLPQPAEASAALEIEDTPILDHRVADTEDPVQVGCETVYVIEACNPGSRAARDMQIMVALPPELELVSAEGPVGHKVEGGKVLFDPVPALAPDEKRTYRVVARAVKAGEACVDVGMKCAQIGVWCLTQETTTVYE